MFKPKVIAHRSRKIGNGKQIVIKGVEKKIYAQRMKKITKVNTIQLSHEYSNQAIKRLNREL